MRSYGYMHADFLGESCDPIYVQCLGQIHWREPKYSMLLGVLGMVFNKQNEGLYVGIRMYDCVFMYCQYWSI